MNKRPIGFHRPEDRMEEMQRRHDKTAGLILKGGAVFGVMWVLWALICLAGTGALAYVAWHFLAKFW